MRISDQFVLKVVAGNYVVVPVGQKAVNFNAIIHLNQVGAFIFRKLQEEDLSIEELVKAMTDEYDIDEQTALNDASDFISKLKENGIL